MTTEDKKIHPTHFQVPEMPYKRKEQQAILLFKAMIATCENPDFDTSDDLLYALILFLENPTNKSLIEWVKNYELG